MTELPDLAATDSLMLTAGNLPPGNYLYTLTSESFTVGENKEAIVKVDMNYGFPYVGADSPSGKPTVTVCAELSGEQTSVLYSDEAWAYSDMHRLAEISKHLIIT